MSNRKDLENKLLRYLNNIFLIYFFLSFLFSRSFIGVYVFGFRIGEIFIGITLLIFVYLLFFNSEIFKPTIFNKSYKFILSLLFLYFLILAILSNSNFLSTYTYKASTYIWTLSLIFMGVISKNLEITKLQLYIIEIGLLFIFIVSIYDVPSEVSEFILTISDKYEPHKGSDLGLFFIMSNLLINRYGNYKTYTLNFFILNLGFFLPLILYRSRGAFIGVSIFCIFELYKYYKNKNLLLLKNIPIFILFIFISTYSTIVSQTKDFPEEISAEVISSSYSSLSEYRLQHYQEDYPILYIENNRIYSGDGNLNWRLWMWQDQIAHMIETNIFFQGTGYKDKLYVFSIDNTGYGNDRKGLDETNENLHNFFLQVLSRGGVIHFVLITYFLFSLINLYIKKTKKLDLLFLMLPLLWISFFDSSMENAHFPLIFYYFLGNIYFKEI